MKFLTVLKDSYREAIDGKIFQAMLVLSGLFILFVASISYRAVTLHEAMEKRLNIFNTLMSLGGKGNAPHFSVERFQVTNAAAEPWNGDYEFEIVVACPTPKALEEIRNSGLPASASSVRSWLQGDFYYLSNVAVTDVPATDPTQGRIKVTTRGTTVTEPTAWPHEPTVLFGIRIPFLTRSLRQLVYFVEKNIVNEIGSRVVLLIGIVVTAGFIPNLLRKGTLDLYVVKPIGRTELLAYKYVGGLIFVFLLTAFTVGGVWVVIGLRSGIWAPEFLLLIPILTIYFAILYAVSVLIGVLSRNALVAILVALLAWGGLSLAGYLNDKINSARQTEEKVRKQLAPNAEPGSIPSALGLPPGVETAIHWACNILPRGSDLDTQANRAIARGVLTEQEFQKEGLDEPLPSWAETIGVSLLWIAILLGLACWRFETRDG